MECAVAPVLKVLEFYSGIGGLRYSLEYAGVSATIVEAFDINDVANDVYEHNFGHRPSQGNIQRLTVQQLDKYKADAWLLSPPCQPYTRQGLQKDVDDGRAASFLELLQLLSDMLSPPSYLFVENVVGFECSVTHDCLREAMAKAEYEIQEFILTPLQFGIPYSRPRYFCLAKRKPLLFAHVELNGSLLCNPGPLQECNSSSFDMREICETPYKPGVEPRTMNEPELVAAVKCYPVGKYIESKPGREEVAQTDIACEIEPSHRDVTKSDNHDPAAAASELWKEFMVPFSTIMRWGDVFDIVTPESLRCCCFTKSYTRFAKGTGSFLAMKASESETRKSELDCRGSRLTDLSLRYFTPREVANFHSFPAKFTFPAHVTLKQRYALLGNSLSVAVVGILLRYLFQSKTSQEQEASPAAAGLDMVGGEFSCA